MKNVKKRLFIPLTLILILRLAYHLFSRRTLHGSTKVQAGIIIQRAEDCKKAAGLVTGM